MFSQCIPQLQKDCKKVIIECSDRMVRYFERNFPGVEVHGTLKDLSVSWDKDQVDAHVHISDLGNFYRQKDSDFPRNAYITPDRELMKKWLDWLSKFPKPWIGVSWKGGIQATQTHLRSIELSDLKPALEKTGTFIDLSYMDNRQEIAEWNIENKGQIVIPPVNPKDYEDTIALLAALIS